MYANAAGDLVLPWGLLVVAVVYYKNKKMNNKWWIKPPDKGFKNDDEEAGWWIITKLIPIGGMFIFGIWDVVNCSSSLKMFVNPEYYAIKDLIAIILQKQPM